MAKVTGYVLVGLLLVASVVSLVTLGIILINAGDEAGPPRDIANPPDITRSATPMPTPTAVNTTNQTANTAASGTMTEAPTD